MREVMDSCHKCGSTKVFKSDGESKLWCEPCLTGALAPSPVVNTGPKINNNDPCHCGSGKKFKKCCK